MLCMFIVKLVVVKGIFRLCKASFVIVNVNDRTSARIRLGVLIVQSGTNVTAA